MDEESQGLTMNNSNADVSIELLKTQIDVQKKIVYLKTEIVLPFPRNLHQYSFSFAA